MFKSLLAIVFDSLSLSSRCFAHSSKKNAFNILRGVVSLKSMYFKINLHLNLFDKTSYFTN